MTNQQLKQRQSLPLEAKIMLTKQRIYEWYNYHHGDIYVAFSGGKDSTVLLDIVRSCYPDTEAVFCDTGMEYPEIRDFVKTFDNVRWLKPKKGFYKIIEEYGYPVISKEVSQKISEARTTKSAKLLHKRLHGDDNPYKSGKIPDKWQYLINSPLKISHKCCHYLKKEISRRYEKETGNKAILGEMVSDSHARRQKYMKNGCNAFSAKRQVSIPMAFWLEKDVWQYIKENNLKYSKIYDMGYQKTGCMFCAFGAHLEKSPNKFQLMRITHPKLYLYCMDTLGMREVLDEIGVEYESNTLFDNLTISG